MAAELPEDPFRETTAGTISLETKGDQVANPLREPVAREELEEVRQQPRNIRRKKPSRFDQRLRVDPLQDNLNVFNNMKPDVSVELGSQAQMVSGEPSDVTEELPSQAPRAQMIRGEPSDVCGEPSQRFKESEEPLVDPLDFYSAYDLVSAGRIVRDGPRNSDLRGEHAVSDKVENLEEKTSDLYQQAKEVIENLDLAQWEIGASSSEFIPSSFKFDKDPFWDLCTRELFCVRILNLNKPLVKMNGPEWTEVILKSLERTPEIYDQALTISEDPSNFVAVGQYPEDIIGVGRNPSDDHDTNNIVEPPKEVSAAEELSRNTPGFPDAMEMTYQGRNTGERSTNNDTAKPSTSSQGLVAQPDNTNADTAGEPFRDLPIYAFLPAVRKMKEVNPSLNMNGPDVVGPLMESVDQRGLDHYLKEAQEIIRNNPSYKHQEEDLFGLESFYLTERATSEYRKLPVSTNTDTIQTSLQEIISDREEAGGFDLLASICDRKDANNINSTINGDQGPSGIDPTLQSEIPENEALDRGIPENVVPYSQIPENRASAIPDKDAPDDLRAQETSEVPKRGRKRKAPTRGSPGVKLTDVAEEGLYKDKGVTRSMRVKYMTQRSLERTEEGARAAKKDAKVANKGRKRKTPPSQQNKKKSTPEENPAGGSKQPKLERGAPSKPQKKKKSTSKRQPAGETQSTESESQRMAPTRQNKKKYTSGSQCAPRSGQEQLAPRRNRQQPAPLDYNDPEGEEHEDNIL